MTIEPLIAGDIMMEGEDQHAVIWVGGDKPIVHATNGDFFGVLQQGLSYFEKFVRGGETVKEATPVWRPQDGELAAAAAKFAQKWAFRSSDDEANKGKVKTPFGAERLNNAEEEKAEVWNVDAVFRAAKAYARGTHGLALSANKGASCSQFVFYCFHAGAIEKAFGSAKLDKSVWQQMNDTGVHQKLFNRELDNFKNLTDPEIRDMRSKERQNRVGSYKDALSDAMPATLQKTAKYMSADYLASVLGRSQDFKKVGCLMADPKSARAGLIPRGDEALKLKYQEALEQFRAMK